MNLRTKYRMLKATTILIGALSIPWGTFIGFCFGEGRYSTGLVALCVQVAVSVTDGYIWFWVLENMREKLEKELPRSPNKVQPDSFIADAVEKEGFQTKTEIRVTPIRHAI